MRRKSTRSGDIQTQEPTNQRKDAPEISWPQRISIVGISGSGKTYLAQQLSEILSLPHIELDRLRTSKDANPGNGNFAHLIEEAIAADSWIIDGHYREVRHMIWRRADLVIHLDFPLVLIAQQLLRRYLQKSLRKPALSPTGQNAGLNLQAHLAPPPLATWRRRLARVSKTLAERREYSQMLQRSEYSGLTVVRLDSHKAENAWIRNLCSKR
jgi:nicotinamide riboside kinase